MRVLIVEPAGNLWGSERALLDLIDGVSDLEFAVCCPPDTPLCAELVKRDIRVLPWFIADLHRKSKLERLKAACNVLRACLQFRPQAIYLNQSGVFKVASVAAKILNLPVIAHVRIFEDAAYLAAQRPSASCLKGVIAISDAIEAEVRRFSELASIRSHKIYDAYIPSAETPSVTKLEEHSADNSRLVCVGRITPIKGQDVLIDALKLIDPDVDCLMVGTGQSDFVDSLKVSGNSLSGLQWMGFQHKVDAILSTASILVCPSRREPLGRVIFESWNAGCVPIVYGGSGGAAEIVEAARGGLLYEEQTPKSLASAIQNALTLTPVERRYLVEAGRTWMYQNCSSKKYGEKMSAILSSA